MPSALLLTLGIALLAACQSGGRARAPDATIARPVRVPFTATWAAKHQLPAQAIGSLHFNVSREVVLRASLEQLPEGVDGQPIFKGTKVVENGHTFDQITIETRDPLLAQGNGWGFGSANFVLVGLPHILDTSIVFAPESSDSAAIFLLRINSDRAVTIGFVDYLLQGPDTPVVLMVSEGDLQREQRVMDELLQVH